MKKNNFKCIAATFLAVLLMVCILPTSAFAASQKPTPGKVTLTKISAPAYNKMTISWKKATNATSYMVYYKKAGTSKWTKLATVSSSKTSYTHTASAKYPLIVGQKYTYTVKAYNSKSKKYGSYNTKGLTKRTLPSAPKLSKPFLNTDGTVTLTWAKANGCDYYYIYRKTSASGKWVKQASVKASTLTYTDDSPYDGSNNIYTVRGYYSKTKVYGDYNTSGVSVFVPESNIPTPTPTPQLSSEELARQVVELTNIERAKVGRAPLTSHPNLQKAAMVRAKELSVYNSHTRPDGRNSVTALWEAGAGCSHGENIATGQGSPEAVVQAWMNSSGHRVAMLSNTATHIGVGHYRDTNGRNYWVQVFTFDDPDKKATITFDPMGGTGGYTLTVPWGQKIYMNDIPAPTKEGYTFGGWLWYGDTINSIEARKDRILCAKWE